MDDKVIIRIKNNLSEISRISKLLLDFSQQNKVPHKINHALDLALDEILNNIINYGYEDHKEHEILIQISLAAKELVLIIEDDGHPFNPLDVPVPDTESSLNERTVGGLGLHLVKNIMDQVQYKYENNKNRIKMVKKIEGE
jgi:anti-sigma regulatory factor (Ser/Thr protein kinase)